MALKNIPISSDLLNILTPYSDWFFSQPDRDVLREYPIRTFNFSCETATGEDYLQHIMGKNFDHEGFPETALCCDLSLGRNEVPSHHMKEQQKVNRELISYLGARNNAVHVYYPKGGWMGWHNNWNAQGYNILLSYNTVERGGYFRYRDPLTRERVTLYDPEKQWTAKVGYFGPKEKMDTVVYHCAGAPLGDRLTIAYVIPDKEIWKMMIEDISGQDAEDFGIN